MADVVKSQYVQYSTVVCSIYVAFIYTSNCCQLVHTAISVNIIDTVVLGIYPTSLSLVAILSRTCTLWQNQHLCVEG